MISQKLSHCFVAYLVTIVGLATAFQTENCNQNLLELQTTRMSKCFDTNFKKVMHLFNPDNMTDNPLGCDFIDKNIACWNDYLGSCFSDEFKNDMATLIDVSFEKSEHISCDQGVRGSHRRNRLDTKILTLTNKYKQYKYHPDRIDSIIKLEKQCSMETAQSSFADGIPCWSSKAQPIFENAQQAVMMSQLSRSIGSSNQKMSLPICKLFTETLECFDLEGCLSEQEIQFLKNLIVTFYKALMNELTRIQNSFGSRGDFLKWVEENIKDNSLGQQDIEFMLDVIYSATEDFQATSCQQNLAKWKDCLIDCTYSDNEYLSIGCWKDSIPRAIPTLEGNSILDGHYKSRTDAVTKCSGLTSSLGYTVFGVQDGGQCVTSSSAAETYNKYGSSSTCLSNGKGGPMANEVYMIKNKGHTNKAENLLPETSAMKADIPFSSVGCWKDSIPRVFKNFEGKSDILDGHYKRRANAIQKCFKAVLSKGYNVFAIQDGGQCFGLNIEAITYNKYGASSDCLSDGKGGPMANEVYRIVASDSVLAGSGNYENPN